jgi:hypothetical protein
MRSLITLSTIALLGAALRVRQFVHARSMWLDEISLAMSFREFNPFGILTNALLERQSAPPGYLFASAISVEIFGTGDRALRLVALLSGLATLALSVVIARRLLTHLATQAAFVALIAISPTLIYYSNEVKQYSTDVLAVCGVLLLWSLRGTPRATLTLGLGGALIAVFSLPGLLVLAALGLALMLEAATTPSATARPREVWKRVRPLTPIALAWAPGVLAHVAYTLATGVDRSFMLNYWSNHDAFPPLRPTNSAEVLWFPSWLQRLGWTGIGEPDRLSEVAGTSPVLIALLLSALALTALIAVPRMRVMLLTPFVLAVLAGLGRIYPTSGRLGLYLVPIVFLAVTLGADALISRLLPRITRVRPSAPTFLATLPVLALVPLLLIQISFTAPAFKRPLNDRNMKAAIQILETHAQDGDTVIFEIASTKMTWYVTPRLASLAHIQSLRSSVVADQGLPADRSIHTYQRVWVTSTHRINQARDLTMLIAELAPFTLVCQPRLDRQTYLALLIRDDLSVDAATRDDPC